MREDLLYVAGGFTRLGNLSRHRAGALELTHGSVLEWAPLPNGSIRALVADGDSVYAGGDFTQPGGNGDLSFGGVAGFAP